MKDIQNLLSQVSIITKKNAEFLDATGGRFNMFRIMGVNHYENTHSAILAELLNPKGSHGLKGKFLQAFVDKVILKESLKDFNCENGKVKTEAPVGNGRIDILIEDDRKHAIIIENKIYAVDQREQLKRYDEFAKKEYGDSNYKIYYLTLKGSDASEQSGGGIIYTPISYSYDIILWLEQCVNLSSRYPLVRETMNQYINHLKLLTNQDMDKLNQIELVELISKPENIESAIKISENIIAVKRKILDDMTKKIAKECSVESEVNNDANGFYFYKNGWKPRAGIWFAETESKTYYSIKTNEAVDGKAVPQKRIEELFQRDTSVYNPFGFGIVRDDHWKNNNELFIKMVDGSFAEETITPKLKIVLNYLREHPEIESGL